jgi:preprotein translocase subunit SecA
MRGLHYAIVDEADSVLVDEARMRRRLLRSHRKLGDLLAFSGGMK